MCSNNQHRPNKSLLIPFLPPRYFSASPYYTTDLFRFDDPPSIPRSRRISVLPTPRSRSRRPSALTALRAAVTQTETSTSGDVTWAARRDEGRPRDRIPCFCRRGSSWRPLGTTRATQGPVVVPLIFSLSLSLCFYNGRYNGSRC